MLRIPPERGTIFIYPPVEKILTGFRFRKEEKDVSDNQV